MYQGNRYADSRKVHHPRALDCRTEGEEQERVFGPSSQHHKGVRPVSVIGFSIFKLLDLDSGRLPARGDSRENRVQPGRTR